MAKLILFGLVVSVIHYFLPYSYRKTVLLLASAVFYLLLDYRMFFLLLITGFWIWWYGLYISPGKKGIFPGIFPLVLILMFFKVNQFFVAEAATLLDSLGIGASMRTLSLMMPLGISYYILKAISYLADVHTGRISADKSPMDVLLYISFFPEIMSGPISRYDSFKRALSEGMTYSEEKLQAGAYLIIKGLFMKAVIANRLAGYTDTIFSDPGSYPALALWINAFFFFIQLYCDFAGYSFIAIGITRVLGLHLQKNFNRPFLSAGITEFWHRWHISLSTWLRDYVYFPLGGSRCPKPRTNLNLFIVFTLCGFWHGSGFQYLVWGFYNGLLRILSPKKKPVRFRAAHIILTFFLCCSGFILFGVDSLKSGISYIARMYTSLSISMEVIQSSILPISGDNTCVAYFLVIMFFIFLLFVREIYEEKKNINAYEPASVPWQVFLLVCILLFGNLRTSSFIYANF